MVNPSSTQLAPSGCACGGKTGGTRQFVFVLGQVGFEFSSSARRDSIWQHMHKDDKNPPNPYDMDQFFHYLDENPWDATSVIWTLKIESVPKYAISVGGPNSAHIVTHLREFIVGQAKYDANRFKGVAQTDDAVERVSIAGVLGGTVTLMTGEEVPVIHPELRGMSGWNTPTFAKRVARVKAADPEGPTRPKAKPHSGKQGLIQAFLERLYFEFRNLGLSAPERAINYIGTNPYGFTGAFTAAVDHQTELHTIEIVRSLVCRPGSDCWDVRLEFFYPDQETATSRHVHRVTVDVSDVVPVTVGEEHFWPSAS
jgi:cyanobactin maturation PatA/PatG family protease